MKPTVLTFSLALWVGLALTGQASAECQIDQFVGYTLLAKKTIQSFIENGEEKNEFSGCNYGRVIVFDDRTGVACDGYSYSYSYRPTAYIWGNGQTLKMCVESSTYSVRPIH